MFETKLIILDTIPMSVGKSCPPNLTANFFPRASRNNICNNIFNKFWTNLQQYFALKQAARNKFWTSCNNACSNFATSLQQDSGGFKIVRNMFAPISQQLCNKILKLPRQEKKQVCIIIWETSLILLLWQARTS